MAYNGTRPADDDKLNISAGIIRDNFEGLRKEGIVIAKSPLYGAGVPSATLGEVGEQYFDTATGDQYLKTASGWTLTLSMAIKADQTALDALGDTIAGLGGQSDENVVKLTGPNIAIFPSEGSIFDISFSGSGWHCITFYEVFRGGPLPKQTYLLTLIIADGGGNVLLWDFDGVPDSSNILKWDGGMAPTLQRSGTDIITLFTLNYGVTWFGAHWGSFATSSGFVMPQTLGI